MPKLYITLGLASLFDAFDVLTFLLPDSQIKGRQLALSRKSATIESLLKKEGMRFIATRFA